MTLGLKQAVHNGVQDAAQGLTGLLRHSAMRNGWSSKAASGLAFAADGASLSVAANTDDAHLAEYGSSDTPPSPAMRKFVNEGQALEAQILASIETHLEGVL